MANDSALPPEVHTKSGWITLGGDTVPQVGESEWLHLRGLEPGMTCLIGGLPRYVDNSGMVRFRLIADEEFRGHLGHLRIRQESVVDAEIKILPDKISEQRYRELRRDLESLWVGITLDSDAVASLALLETPVDLPPVRELWESIDREVSSISRAPRMVLRETTRLGRLEQARHPRQITEKLIFNGQVGLPGPMRILESEAKLPENAMVGEVLRKLLRLCQRDPDSGDLAVRLQSLLRVELFRQTLKDGFQPTHGVLKDSRYLKLFHLYQFLVRRETMIIEGPGEIREGIRAMQDLWEYWVFLQTVRLCNEKFGEPADRQLQSLVRKISARRIRLELPPQTTIEYPNGILLAYEPQLNKSSEQSWNHLCLAEKGYETDNNKRTPDVVIFRPGTNPRAVVLDAKYVGRGMVDGDSISIHKKYGRLSYRGKSVRSEVFAVHTHEDMEAHYAGHGHFPMWPGNSINGREIFDFLFPEGSRSSPSDEA